jgi:ubiquinone/menaquinone biosynthesis C-methylase UbiE
MEMLVKLGVGSAHPGGFTATLEQLRQYPIAAGSNVLEVGCGTGRTACYLARQGCQVTAVDIRPGMLAKARKRAEEEGVRVLWLQADARALPFEEGSFDCVMVESVSLFTDTARAVGEYCRVLKPGGRLYDRELMALSRTTPELEEEIREFYGFERLLTPQEWIQLLNQSGYAAAEIWKPGKFSLNTWEDTVSHPDHLQSIDQNALNDLKVWEITRRYDDIMTRYSDWLGYGVAIGEKK